MSSSADHAVVGSPTLSLPWLTRLNTLCLLEPIVGLAWQELLASSANVLLTPAHRSVLALSLWLGYAADRWLDARRLPRPLPDEGLTERHRFFANHSRRLACIWVAVCGSDLAIALSFLSWEELTSGGILLCITATYLVLAQLPRKARRRLKKELLAAVVFVLGASLFSWSWRWEFELHKVQLVLVTLATLNLLAICHLEHETDGLIDSNLPPDRPPLAYKRFGRSSWPLLASFGLLLSWLNSPADASLLCAAVSASLCWVLVTETAKRHIEAATTHGLLDVVLLVPAVPLFL